MQNMNNTSLPMPSFESKIKGQGSTKKTLEDAMQGLEKPVVFTNGVFDILHRGHVSYLDQAKSLGKSLVVAVNSDQSVRGLGKGDERPLNTLDDRMALLAALESVDLVVCFEEQTPVEILKIMRPEIYVKGGDYQIETLPETSALKEWGGRAIAIPFIYDRSTTKLVQKIRS